MKYLILRDNTSVKVEDDFAKRVAFVPCRNIPEGYGALHVNDFDYRGRLIERLVFFKNAGGVPVAYAKGFERNPRDVIKICETEAEAVAFILTR